ncbi:hypothetical protein PPL_10833 [Heterostelium album PN500]|uniref:FNIP repeat-containing protein n=1 Tax=Heterostelium pallidum (strain ATCC 26659 / Pp 5 / PN500) TaxID=670386 RepID=D3BS41_HETP5|nr:hypothetical protein PPL_10833 [Heterostelium album PN500]EFA75778.1 hypothetical protein PPL_10833 [Heterostelium album PN500]|eukprot:XP_020427912.1 hypothetical protein PPL_10833 [Heterostelium album PN500]
MIKDDLRCLKSIPSNVTTVYVTTKYDLEADQEYLYRLILESQSVTVLNGCNTLKYGLPKSIKSIIFNNFNEPLFKGSLPNTLEIINFEDRFFKQEILPGVLPVGLHKLYLNNYQHLIQAGVLPVGLRVLSLFKYQHEILPGILPVGLKRLSLSFYGFEIKPGVLPDGLREFSFGSSFGFQYDIQPGVLPSSLEYLSIDSFNPPVEPVETNLEDLQYSGKSFLPISWLQAISSLSNLQSLSIYIFHEVGHDNTIFNVNYLPPTLKTFYFTLRGTALRGTMPTSLKSIYLDCQYNINEIYPETKKYHLEFMECENNIIKLIPSNIKIDELIIRGESREPKITLPTGFGKIKLSFILTDLKDSTIEFGREDTIDHSLCSLRELHLPTFKDGPPKIVKLPNTIEYLNIGNNDLNDILHLIPSSLNTLVFDKQSEINISISNTIKSITNLIVKFEMFNIRTIRKLDDNYYVMYGECSRRLIARIFHHSKLDQILNNLQ